MGNVLASFATTSLTGEAIIDFFGAQIGVQICSENRFMSQKSIQFDDRVYLTIRGQPIGITLASPATASFSDAVIMEFVGAQNDHVLFHVFLGNFKLCVPELGLISECATA